MEQYELYHFGVPGMKWGVRKEKQLTVTSGRAANYGSKTASRQAVNRQKNQSVKTTRQVDPKKLRVQKAKRAVGIGAAVAGSVLAVYGAKKLNDVLSEYAERSRRKGIVQLSKKHLDSLEKTGNINRDDMRDWVNQVYATMREYS